MPLSLTNLIQGGNALLGARSAGQVQGQEMRQEEEDRRLAIQRQAMQDALMAKYRGAEIAHYGAMDAKLAKPPAAPAPDYSPVTIVGPDGKPQIVPFNRRTGAAGSTPVGKAFVRPRAGARTGSTALSATERAAFNQQRQQYLTHFPPQMVDGQMVPTVTDQQADHAAWVAVQRNNMVAPEKVPAEHRIAGRQPARSKPATGRPHSQQWTDWQALPPAEQQKVLAAGHQAPAW